MLAQQNFIKRYWATEILPMFKLQYVTADLIAALAVTFVAIPLSLAIALATGVSAQVILISVVVGGLLGALFGSCRLGITGPAVAMSVLLAEVINNYGFTGLLVVGLICGILQIGCGLLKLGRLSKYVPLSLVLAFSAGIGVLLFFEQLPNAFQIYGLQANTVMNSMRNAPIYWQHISSAAFLLTLITIALLALVPRWLPRSYAFIAAVAVPMLIVNVFQLDVVSFSALPHSLTPHAIADLSSIKHWNSLLFAGVEVFLLASLETLLSTNAVDVMGQGDLHSPNHELIGQGIANIGVAVCGGIPVTGVIARSSVNILAGAKTRRAAILHTLMVLAIIYLAPHLIEEIPLAVLAGILLAAAIKMMNLPQVYDLWKKDRWEVAVYLITFITIVVSDLVDGIQIGLLAAFIIVGVRMLNTKTELKLWTNNNVLRVSLTGSITFFSYEQLARIKEHALEHSKVKFVIFECRRLQNLDNNGTKHLLSIANDLAALNIRVIFHGLSDEHTNLIATNSSEPLPYLLTVTEYQIKEILEKSGVTHSATDVLRHGITKYISNYAKDQQNLLSTLAKGQKPHTLLITCADSRLNPNAFFSAEIGEIFIVRNVGNVVPPFMPEHTYSEIAAIEFAVAELGVRNIVICAHTECGAIKASIASADKSLGHIGLDNWLGLIKDGFKINKPDNADDGVKINLLQQVENLKTYPQVGKMIEQGQITVSAWIYDVHSGQMREWDAKRNEFVKIA